MDRKNEATFTDKILAATFLRLIPKSVTPNQVTVFRFITVPFVLWLIFTERYLSGIILFAVSAFTDALDGAMARTRGQITDWGRIYDPVADRFLIGLTAIVLLPRFLDTTIIFLIVGMEILIGASNAYLRTRTKKIMQANTTGKIKMIIQSFGVGLVMLHAIIYQPDLLTFSSYLLYTSLFFGLISLIGYWTEYRDRE